MNWFVGESLIPQSVRINPSGKLGFHIGFVATQHLQKLTNDRPALIEADKMKAILAEIDADRAAGGWCGFVIPRKTLRLAGAGSTAGPVQRGFVSIRAVPRKGGEVPTKRRCGDCTKKWQANGCI